MKPAAKNLAISFSLMAIVCSFACSQSASKSSDQGPTAAATPEAKTITAADLQKLKWIEGAWRGTGSTTQPFYERYRFENETTLVMEELADETLSKVTKTTRYELKDSRFGTDRAVATALDDQSITFSPLIAGSNSFRWQSESKDVWKAILTLPASGTHPAKETVYVLERIK